MCSLLAEHLRLLQAMNYQHHYQQSPAQGIYLEELQTVVFNHNHKQQQQQQQQQKKNQRQQQQQQEAWMINRSCCFCCAAVSSACSCHTSRCHAISH
jgi:hypothetical protein